MGYKVMQLETSNVCSLTCSYCPHPSQVRPKGDMTMETYQKCIEAVKRSDNPEYRGKKFVWLNHFGEPLLNPLLPEFIAHAVARDVEVSFASNGVDHQKNLFPREYWQTLADVGLKGVMLSAHVKSERVLRQQVEGIVKVIAVWKPKPEFLHDWAGQVKPTNLRLLASPPPSSKPCDYETHDMFAVTWDGMLAACCYDIEGGVGQSIDEVLRDGFRFRRITLCSSCSLGRGDAAWIAEPLEQTLS